MTDDDLELFVTDARAHLDRTLAAVAAPDLAASVARAREIDPGAVPAQAVSDASALAPVVQLRPSRGPTQVREHQADRAALTPFTAALRDQLEADLARRIHRAAIAGGSAGPVVAAPPQGRTPRRVLAVSLALAAAVLLAFGLRGAFEARQQRTAADAGAAALAGAADDAASAAVQRAAMDRSPGASDRPEPGAPEDSSPVPEDSSPVPEDSSPVPGDSSPVPEDSSAGPGATAADAGDDRARPARRPGKRPAPATAPEAPPAPPPEDPLVALDREAQALWQAGDLSGAAAKFRAVIARAPGSRAAEAAYGDLFAVEHRLGGDPVALWRAYLGQFPAGRYADDARAGVCRREPEPARPACWEAYLAAHPSGAHRREAEQAAAAPARDP